MLSLESGHSNGLHLFHSVDIISANVMPKILSFLQYKDWPRWTKAPLISVGQEPDRTAAVRQVKAKALEEGGGGEKMRVSFRATHFCSGTWTTNVTAKPQIPHPLRFFSSTHAAHIRVKPSVRSSPERDPQNTFNLTLPLQLNWVQSQNSKSLRQVFRKT